MKFRWWQVALFGSCLVGAAWLSYRTLLVSAPETPGARNAGAPNVVLISIDTTRPDHLGCYGYGKKTSPNIDRLAREGIRFSKARSQAPWTLPSHMSLFTSMLPSHNTMDFFTGALPSEIPTLAQILKKHEYNTAALVNNAQMMANSGFARGFDIWREFPSDTHEGDCDNITAHAIHLLRSSPPQPFFLFLHYYDPHLPYDPPERFRQKFGSSLSREDTNKLMMNAILPSAKLPDAALWTQVIGSYDGEIAWLDEELGKLFQHLSDDTLVVLFSDHGEAFKEHGVTGHGTTLYEEEIRTALVMRHPRLLPEPKVIDEPVMLMDVAPTILSLCGIEPPAHYEGTELTPLWQGKHLPDRLILAETKPTFFARVLKMAIRGDWKLVYSVLEGKQELYKLPDEHTDLSKKDIPMAKALFEPIQRWVEGEDFWMVHVQGQGEFTSTFVVQGGQIRLYNPLEEDRYNDRDVQNFDPSNRIVKWTSNPQGRSKAVFLQVEPKDCIIRWDFQINGVRQLDKVHFGPQGSTPTKLPVDFNLADQTLSPIIEKPFQPPSDGFFVRRYRGKNASSRPSQAGTIDAQMLRQLKTLGYIN